MPLKFPRASLALVGMLGWLVAIAFGFQSMHAFVRTPGPAGRPPVTWPAGSRLPREEGRPEVIMSVHPQCPCTRASLATLGEIVRDSGRRPAVRLLIYRPAGSVEGWGGAAARGAAGSIPGAVAVDDPGGIEASRFGLETSGAVAVFDARGRLQYSGGLNSGRGELGRSRGAESLASVLAGREPLISGCDAFGCPLSGPTVSGPARGDQP